MTNEQKAREIATQNYCTNKRNMDISFRSAMAMAEWKDKEFEYILTIAFESIGEQNGHCSKDLFEYQDKIRELIKDSSNQ